MRFDLFGLLQRPRPSRRRTTSRRTGPESLEVRVLPATLHVTTMADVSIDGDGLLSLREAISIADAPGLTIDGITSADLDDEIVFDVDGTLLLETSLSLDGPLTITGNGPDRTIIDGQLNSRIFNMNFSLGSVSLAGLTLRNGRETQDNFGGGAVFAIGAGVLSIDGCVFVGNSTTGNDFADGGAVRVADGWVVVTDSRFENNATTGANGRGGAIATFSGSVLITNTTFTNNSTSGDGAFGGAVFTFNGDVHVRDSTFNGNSTLGPDSPGGAITSLGGQIVVTNSTLSGNFTAGVDSVGGAIFSTTFFNEGSVVVVNSTIIHNSAQDAEVGGIFSAGPLDIRNSIIALNTSSEKVTDLRSDAGVTAFHSIIGNRKGTGLRGSPRRQNADGNFVGRRRRSVDPGLAPLADNGGDTLTHALLPGSLARNSGRNDLAAHPGPDGIPGTIDDQPLDDDQRGPAFPRFNGIVDMGAFEA